MNSIGWLDHSRVWKNAGKDVDIEIILRPLHQRTLKGYLAALLNDYFWIEFRVNEGWDKEIPRPVVLVHYYFGGKSYLVKNSNGEKDGIKGSIYSLDSNVFPATWLAPPFQRIEVLDIDAKARIARIGIKSKKGKLSKANTNTFKEISKGSKGVTNDGGGWIIIGNQIIRIPPRTPQYDLLVGISNILAADNSEKIASKHSFRIKGYNKILKIAKEEIEHLHISEGVSDPK
jgi:hypothetical protein